MASGLSTNGKFTLANAIITLAAGFFMMVTAWLTSSVIELREFKAAGERFSASDASAMQNTIMLEVEKRYPPKWLTNDIAEIKVDIKAIQLEHRRIFTRLGVDGG